MVAFPDGIGMDEAGELVGPESDDPQIDAFMQSLGFKKVEPELLDPDGFKLCQPPAQQYDASTCPFTFNDAGCQKHDCNCAPEPEQDPMVVVQKALLMMAQTGQQVTIDAMASVVVYHLIRAGWLPEPGE